MLNRIYSFLNKISKPIGSLIILFFFLISLFFSFFNDSKDIFVIKLYYNSIQQDNSDFNNYLLHEINNINISDYKEINAEQFLDKNTKFSLESFNQINNYIFLQKDNSYIVKNKYTNNIEYVESFKASKPYHKYKNIIDNSSFDNKIITNDYYFIKVIETNNLQIENIKLYNKNDNEITFLKESYKNDYLIQTQKYYSFLFTIFLYISSFLLLMDVMSYNKRFNKFLKSQSRKKDSNNFKNIEVKIKETQKEEKELLIKINK